MSTFDEAKERLAKVVDHPGKRQKRMEIVFHANVARYHLHQILPDLVPKECIAEFQAMAMHCEKFQLSLEKYLKETE